MTLVLEDALERMLTTLSSRSYSPRIKLLDINQVREALGLSQSTVYELVQSGSFPKPFKLGRRNMWRESALIAWLNYYDPNKGAPWLTEPTRFRGRRL